MPTVIVTYGFPASGKTTWAKKWVAEYPDDRVLVSRDDIRVDYSLPFGTDEGRVTRIHNELVARAAAAGKDIVVANTNLKLRDAAMTILPAVLRGYDYEVRRFVVDEQELLIRNARRTGWARVPDDVMLSMFNRHPYRSWWSDQQLADRLDRALERRR